MEPDEIIRDLLVAMRRVLNNHPSADPRVEDAIHTAEAYLSGELAELEEMAESGT